MNVEELREKRDALVAEREAVIGRVRHMSDSLDTVAEYVEREKLDSLSADITILNDEIRRQDHDAAEPEARAPQVSERLTLLLRRQDEARVERAEMVRAREEIQRRADEDGRADLDAEEDRQFRALTYEIAYLDGEVVGRDTEIEVLAALAARSVEEV